VYLVIQPDCVGGVGFCSAVGGLVDCREALGAFCARAVETQRAAKVMQRQKEANRSCVRRVIGGTSGEREQEGILLHGVGNVGSVWESRAADQWRVVSGRFVYDSGQAREELFTTESTESSETENGRWEIGKTQRLRAFVADSAPQDDKNRYAVRDE